VFGNTKKVLGNTKLFYRYLTTDGARAHVTWIPRNNGTRPVSLVQTPIKGQVIEKDATGNVTIVQRTIQANTNNVLYSAKFNNANKPVIYSDLGRRSLMTSLICPVTGEFELKEIKREDLIVASQDEGIRRLQEQFYSKAQQATDELSRIGREMQAEREEESTQSRSVESDQVEQVRPVEPQGLPVIPQLRAVEDRMQPVRLVRKQGITSLYTLNLFLTCGCR
jgi:hypothetical protein